VSNGSLPTSITDRTEELRKIRENLLNNKKDMKNDLNRSRESSNSRLNFSSSRGRNSYFKFGTLEQDTPGGGDDPFKQAFPNYSTC